MKMSTSKSPHRSDDPSAARTGPLVMKFSNFEDKTRVNKYDAPHLVLGFSMFHDGCRCTFDSLCEAESFLCDMNTHQEERYTT